MSEGVTKARGGPSGPDALRPAVGTTTLMDASNVNKDYEEQANGVMERAAPAVKLSRSYQVSR